MCRTPIEKVEMRLRRLRQLVHEYAVGLAALVVGAVAVGVRIPGVFANSLWQDEVVSANIILEPTPVAMFRHVARTESTPPVWYGVVWLGHRLGVSVVDLRLLSVLAGGLLAGLVVLWGRRFMPLWASILAGALVALGSQFVTHGSELRAYELYAICAFLFAVALERFSETPTRRNTVLLTGSVLLGSLTHYFFLLFVVAGIAWLLLSPDLKTVRVRAGAAMAVGLLPFVVWLPVLKHQYDDKRFGWIGSFDLRTVLTANWLLFTGAWPGPGLVREVLAVGLMIGVVAGALALLRRPGAGRLCALCAVVPVTLGALIWLAGAPIFAVRNILGAGAFTALSLCYLASRAPRTAVVICSSTLVALAIFGVVDAVEHPPPDFRQTSHALLASGWQPNDPIVLYGDFFAFRGPLRWYLRQPELTLAERTQRVCGRVFVVSAQRRPSARLLRARLTMSSDSVDGILVFRVLHPPPLTDPVWKGGRILLPLSTRSACVRPLPERLVLTSLRTARL